MSYILAMVSVDVRGASEEYFFPCVRYRRRRVQSESAVGRKKLLRHQLMELPVASQRLSSLSLVVMI